MKGYRYASAAIDSEAAAKLEGQLTEAMATILAHNARASVPLGFGISVNVCIGGLMRHTHFNFGCFGVSIWRHTLDHFSMDDIKEAMGFPLDGWDASLQEALDEVRDCYGDINIGFLCRSRGREGSAYFDNKDLEFIFWVLPCLRGIDLRRTNRPIHSV